MAGVELFFTDSGGDGRAVLLLHGQPGSGSDLRALSAALAPHARVLVPDRPGYGETGGEAVGFVENARRALRLLDRLGLRSATFAGHSWGAGVALAAAELEPARVDALALISPVTPFASLGLFDRALAHHTLGPPLVLAGFGLVGHSLALRPLRQLVARALPGVPSEAIAATAAKWRGAQVARSFHAEQRALVDELPKLAVAVTAIQQPAVVLSGMRDRIASPRNATQLASLLPNGRLVQVEGAGHLLPQQHAALVASEILGSLDPVNH